MSQDATVLTLTEQAAQAILMTNAINDFSIDPKLTADTMAVGELDLCTLRLMNDARFVWLIAVPRRAGLTEIIDLPVPDRAALWREIDHIAATLKLLYPDAKLNIGALGNVVRQLHIHIIARQANDAAWPGSVWGAGAAMPYDDAAANDLVAQLQEKLDLSA